jgi:uncharacterized membrane protein YphA (DoxX/SURF4 family)
VSAPSAADSRTQGRMNGFVVRGARWVLGAVFIYLGLIKALHPVDFLKVVRQYDVFEHHVVLNSVAALLPWFEVFCGALLVFGIAVRGSALALFALLLSFTAVILRRAWSLHILQSIPFCAVRFDCGCGTGEVLICAKLVENALLMLLAVTVVVAHVQLRHPRA